MNTLNTTDNDSKTIYFMSFLKSIIMVYILTKLLNYIMVDKTIAGEISLMAAGPIAAFATVGSFLLMSFLFFLIMSFVFKLDVNKANSKIVTTISIVGMLIGGVYLWKDMHDYTSLKFIELDKQITENNYIYNPATADFLAYKKESDNFTKCVSTCALTLNKFYAKKDNYLLVDKSLRDALKAEYLSLTNPVLKDVLEALFTDDVFSVGDKIFLRSYLTQAIQPDMLKSYPQLEKMLELVSNGV